MNTPQQRQYLGCGYEPPLDGARTMWQPPTGKRGYQGDEPGWCAGYTTTLPEVQEVSLMHRHWSKGGLSTALLGDAATEDLCSAIVVLDAEYSARDSWCMTPAAEGGGGS